MGGETRRLARRRIVTWKELASNWRNHGCPAPPDISSQPDSEVRARRLLAQVQNQFIVQTDEDKNLLYGVVALGRRVENIALRDSVTRLLALADWPDDSFDELSELRQAWARDMTTLDQSETIRRVLAGMESLPQRAEGNAIERRKVVDELALIIEISPADAFRLSLRILESLRQDPKRDCAFSGEIAFLTGSGARFLRLTSEALQFFSEAESYFENAPEALPNRLRVRYQMLASAVEERRLAEVAYEAPVLQTEFERLGMEEWAIKCLYLLSVVCNESSRSKDTIQISAEVLKRSLKAGSAKMEVMSLVSMAIAYADLGDQDRALERAALAMSALGRFPSPLTLAKLHWSIGRLFRNLGSLDEAEQVHRVAMAEMKQLGLDAEVAAIRLVLTEILLEAGKRKEALAELRRAIPILEKHEMVKESLAAIALLKKSLQDNRVDRRALVRLQNRRTI